MVGIEEKYRRLKKQLHSYESLIIAYSGGIDSALLLKVAHDVLGDRVLAVMADSPSVPRREIEQAQRIARDIGARMRIINTHEIEDENYVQNPFNRCYFCKSELYTELFDVAKEENFKYIANGTNIDDLGDYRPGLQAADEYRVESPLRDAGFSKSDIRILARQLGLAVWDKPASPCLASRIPYGQSVTVDKLAQVDRAEEYLHGLGIRELRVRHFGQKARIEVNRADFEIIEQQFEGIKSQFLKIGFQEIEVSEFKSGALNELIHANQ